MFSTPPPGTVSGPSVYPRLVREGLGTKRYTEGLKAVAGGPGVANIGALEFPMFSTPPLVTLRGLLYTPAWYGWGLGLKGIQKA